MGQSPRRPIDVAIVGAGLSGLVCARRLADAGARVIVHEAQDRVGGRLLGGRCGDATVDLGGAWISTGQARVTALVRELGLTTTPQVRDGEAIVALDTPTRWRALAAFAIWRAQRRLARMIRAPDPRWDARSLGDFLGELPPSARSALALHAELTFATAPADLSLLFYVTQLAATGGLGDPSRAQELRVVGGAHQLALRLAEGLDVRLGSPVRSLDDLVADRVVLAIPPALARTLAPPPLAALAAASRPGPVVKVVCGYERAFWRDAGLSGEAYQARGAVRAVVDLSEPGGQPALLAFVVADEARGDDVRARALADLATLFGEHAPTDVAVRDWGRDPWSAGCVATWPPGAGAGTWAGTFGRIHVAGTESAREWPGYMEGAIEAGERVAREVLDALG